MSIILPGQEETERYGSVDTSQPFIKGPDVENPWNERHDVPATQKAIQEMLSLGTPNWVKWPQDYRSYMREAFAEEKEKSDNMGAEYRWHDQEMLTNKEARQVNRIGTRDFVEHKLKANGVDVVVMASDWRNHGGGPTVALWANPPGRNKLRYVCYMDVPFMWEWSVLRLDRHGLPSGEESRGWRTVAVQLVEKEVITEAQCHKIFGVPGANAISARYYRSLWEKRHGRKYQDEDERGLAG